MAKYTTGGVTEFLVKHAGQHPVSFHMPGHKGSDIYRRYGHGDFLDVIMDCDITEITGADNLFQMEGIIHETAEKYRDLYEVKASYPLINGTSGGLIAAILASVPSGGRLIMARNCHKSVFNALGLGNISPVYAYPSMIEGYGIAGEVTAEEIERCIAENPDASAVILPSPNYYGICSDIKAIAEVVHRYGKVLIVDQAHGAHLKFLPEQPAAAEECGADIDVNSTHKTLASFTQSAVLNLASERVDRFVLEDKLQVIESSSPSYLLMASLDNNAELVREHGKELFGQWQENLNWFYENAVHIPGMKLMQVPGKMDGTKINIDMSPYGLDGGQLEELLMEEGIFVELVTGNILMCMTGIGNRRGDFEKLLDALKKIADSRELRNEICGGAEDVPEHPDAGGSALCMKNGSALWTKKRELQKLPEKKQLVHIDACEDMICASSIIPYPPGIPLICPGEVIGREDIDYIRAMRDRGEKVIGLSEDRCVYAGL